MAAGLSIAKEHLVKFEHAFKLVVGEHLNAELKSPDLVCDGQLAPQQLSLEHAKALREAGPWGQAFPEPLFFGVFRVVEQKLLAQKHLRLILCPDEFQNVVVDAIAFNIDTEQWPNTLCNQVKLVYRLDVNTFRGRSSVQLMVEQIEAWS